MIKFLYYVQMQTHTDGMEAEMKRLQKKMENIDESSKNINNVIGQRITRIEVYADRERGKGE
tara:strand:- start:299 stop:484 length:186 start_codon:yes stop_codon:yes gene_type:complete